MIALLASSMLASVAAGPTGQARMATPSFLIRSFLLREQILSFPVTQCTRGLRARTRVLGTLDDNSASQPRRIILASQSPRRRELLSALGYDFQVRVKDVDESVDGNVRGRDVAKHLAVRKAKASLANLASDEVVITADTVVLLDDEVLGKPETREEAIQTLTKLSGRSHEVVTGVCIAERDGKMLAFDDVAIVTFRDLTKMEIEYYVQNFEPYDKAGSYGIQDWIGLSGVERLEGSYFTVMGLPTSKVYEALFNQFGIKLSPSQ